MRVLGLETSCDETAAAVVEDGRRALSDVVSTQVDIHRRWGGVVPELASRNHVVQVLPVVDEALRRARCSLQDLDLIAVTRGPGLLGALLVGVQLGKSLSVATGIPLVGVNHLEGHLLAARLLPTPPEPPFLALVVSGGHTSLYAVKDFGQYRRWAAPATTPRARRTTRWPGCSACRTRVGSPSTGWPRAATRGPSASPAR